MFVIIENYLAVAKKLYVCAWEQAESQMQSNHGYVTVVPPVTSEISIII